MRRKACASRPEPERTYFLAISRGEQAERVVHVLHGGPVAPVQILEHQEHGVRFHFGATLTEIGSGQNSTIVFPLPLDVIKPFVERGAAPSVPPASPSSPSGS